MRSLRLGVVSLGLKSAALYHRNGWRNAKVLLRILFPNEGWPLAQKSNGMHINKENGHFMLKLAHFSL